MDKDLYSSLKSEDEWMIRENDFDRSLQNIREAQFSIGNGYIGIRGVLEEIPHESSPGTYISGIYDKIGSQVAELANLPNPVNFKFITKGEKIGIPAMDVSRHSRVLNMKKGLLIRNTTYKDTQSRRLDYQSLRFMSMRDKNVGVMQAALTPLDAACALDIVSDIDTSVFNSGILSEGKKRHFCINEVGRSRSLESGYVIIDICHRDHAVIYWSGLYYELGGKKVFAKDNILHLRLERGQMVVFTKIFYMKHFLKRGYAAARKKTFKEFSSFYRGSFHSILEGHMESWSRLWNEADVRVEAQGDVQQNIRFNIYHMIICGHVDGGFSSIGARTLSGEGYRGHIFWDAEIYLLPFYLFTFPRIARNMLAYRCRRMDQARGLAAGSGYQGAKFPWESADTGEEETPEWARDIDRTIVKIHTHTYEHHITADIAYAVYKYYEATLDEKFMSDCGYDLFFETARFWAARVSYDRKKDRFSINHIIGPDEFHIDVNNNAFTNIMAKWNLLTAYDIFSKIKKEKTLLGAIKSRSGVSDKEADAWREIASKIRINTNKNRIIEQFDGYFKLKKITLSTSDENGIPLLPQGIKAKELGRTQLVKQPDVLMLFCMLNDIFTVDSFKANYEYYMRRTVHKSSLSLPMHALLACHAGDLKTAYSFFNISLRADISNAHTNTAEGIHAASLGGTWQVIVFGFAGLSVDKAKLSIEPRLPFSWKRIAISIKWRGDTIRLIIANDIVRLKCLSARRHRHTIAVFGKETQVNANRTYTFRRDKGGTVKKDYHY